MGVLRVTFQSWVSSLKCISYLEFTAIVSGSVKKKKNKKAALNTDLFFLCIKTAHAFSLSLLMLNAFLFYSRLSECPTNLMIV